MTAFWIIYSSLKRPEHCHWPDLMYLKTLRNIRERILSELLRSRSKPSNQNAIGIGAAGDKTFPIDKSAEDIIISELESSGFPFSIVSEEFGLKDINGGGKKVVIDPIDGSKNAISGIPFYCTSIAIAEGDKIGSVESAYIINLITGDEFRSEKGRGAFLNDEQIFTQGDDVFHMIAYEAQVPGRDIMRVMPLLAGAHKTRCFGATALDLSYLAYGSISVFVNPALSRSFDFAAGWLLVKEAGGTVTDFHGNSIEIVELGLIKSTPLLASGNQKLHEKALRILNG